MELLDAILVIDSLAEKKATRTVVQKLSYFLEVLDLIDARFRPHYYGPYSDEIQEKLISLVDIGFAEERIVRLAVPSDSRYRKKYIYTVTDDGKEILKEIQKNPEYEKIKEIIAICKEKSDFNIEILSAAAKICYILHREEKAMTLQNIKEEGDRLGWNIKFRHIDRVVSLLESLDLTRRSS